MPELPEVQTIISDLNRKIKGDTITGFWTDWPKAIKNMSAKRFVKEIRGRKILEARRIGKNIFIELSGEKTIYIHLKMTGHLLVKSKIKNQKSRFFNDKVNQYIHHIFYLASHNLKPRTQKYNKTLEFSDLRKFGKILLIDTDGLKETKDLKSLGIDVMDSRFTFKQLAKILDSKKNKKIRDILMDQSLMAGIGNIYASEILFEAGILPARIAKEIGDRETKRIYNSIKKVLNKAIELRGTSDSDYRDTSGAPGKFQEILKVYQREGQRCQKCGTMVKRVKIGQRSAFYCSRCQR